MASRKGQAFTGFDFVVEPFAFLVRDYGFAGPRCTVGGVEFHHVYSQADVEIDVWLDGAGPHIGISIGGWAYHLSNLDVTSDFEPYKLRYEDSCLAAARFLEDHPELLCGDADYLDALEDQWYVRSGLRPWRRGLRTIGYSPGQSERTRGTDRGSKGERGRDRQHVSPAKRRGFGPEGR